METIRGRVMELCVTKLAQQLYECVNCANQDRAQIDWNWALGFVESAPQLVDAIVAEFVGGLAREQLADILPATLSLEYPAFDRLCGRAVWDRMFQQLKHQLLYPYTNIRFG